MSRPIDDEDPVVPGERREDRHHLEGTAEAAMDIEEWGAGTKFQHPGLALRPTHTADFRLGCIPREESLIGQLDLPVQFVVGVVRAVAGA